MKVAAPFLMVGFLVSAGTLPAVADQTPEAASGVAWHDTARRMLTEIALPAPKEGPWLIVGPFDRAAFDFPFAPESKPGAPVDPTVVYRGKQSEQLAWKPVEIPVAAVKDLEEPVFLAANPPVTILDLRRLCPGYDADGTFYLTRTIISKEARTYAIAIRGVNGLVVWLNGKQLVDRGPDDLFLAGGPSGTDDPKEALLLPLSAGENRLLVRVHCLRKNPVWHFVYGGHPTVRALGYTISNALTRQHPEAFVGLAAMLRDGLDPLKVWPIAKDTDTTERLLEGAKNALARSDGWLKFLLAAKVPENDLAESAAQVQRIRTAMAEHDNSEPLDPPRLVELYFSANEACRRLETLPQGMVIANWLQLDEMNVQSPMDAKVVTRMGEVLRRGRALADDYGTRLVSAAGEADRLTELQGRLESLSDEADPEAVRQLYIDAHTQVRQLVLKNPLLSFQRILFYKRYSPRTLNYHRHQFPTARYMNEAAHAGGDLCVLDGLQPDGKLQPLLQGRLGRGIVRGFDLSYDAERVVFGFWNSDVKRPAPKRRFEYDCYVTEGHTNIYELQLATGSIRQLTDEPWHDVDPSYLPGGRITFASERCACNAECDPAPWSEPNVNLYTMGRDGGDVRRLIANKDSDNFARVLNDGRIFYTHWEYHERHWLPTQSLWVSQPDGTQQDALFKQHLDKPYSLVEGRAIPGSNKVAAIASGHHSNAAGGVVRINLKPGLKAVEALEIVTPRVAAFEGGLNGKTVPEGGVRGHRGFYTTPWPLSEKYFLVSYNPHGDGIDLFLRRREMFHSSLAMARAEGYGIYLIDVFGNRELIYRDPNISCFSPVSLAAREEPPVLPDRTDPSLTDATLMVANVYQGMDVPHGVVKYLRINESMPWPYTKEGASRPTIEHDWSIKRTLGLVPVEADGSAHFVVPADIGVYFQALDENFLEVRRMRSLVSFQPGEQRGCTGCHETQTGAPPASTTIAGRRDGSRFLSCSCSS